MSKPVDPVPNNGNSKYTFAAVIFAAVLVRGAALLALPDGLNQDTDGYRSIAETVRNSRVFGVRPQSAADQPAAMPVRPTAFRPPLYPLLLSIFVTDGRLTPVAVGIVHLVCGVLTVAIVWILGVRWGLGKWAVCAALLTGCDPILLHQSTQLMTETLATLAAVSALWSLTKCWEQPSSGNALLAGVLLGLACLCRPTFLPWSGFVVAYCLCTKLSIGRRIRIGAIVLTGICLAVFPWGLRNYLHFGRMTLTTTHGGYTLLLANNPSFYKFLRDGQWGGVWDSRDLDAAWQKRASLRDANDELLRSNGRQANLELSNRVETARRSEHDDDQLAYEFARRFIGEDPPMFAYSNLYRVGSLWQVLPHRLSDPESAGRCLMRYFIAVWYVAVYGAGGVGIWKLRGRLIRPPWVWGILLCVSFSAVHALYWSNMRMRAPLMPFVALLAAAGMGTRTLIRGVAGVQN